VTTRDIYQTQVTTDSNFITHQTSTPIHSHASSQQAPQ